MKENIFYSINVAIHVMFGTAALIAGIIALRAIKGGRVHKKAGIFFLSFLCLVVLTGLAGIFFFKVNLFLLVITLLSFYQGYSGYRVLQHKEKGPSVMDAVVTVLTVASAIYFLYYISKAGFVWSPVVIYSTLGWLGIITMYDFCRYLIPEKKYQQVWIYEYIIKMIGTYSAILSAFIGTVLPVSFQPFSQVIPSALGSLLIIAFCIAYRNNTVYNTGNVFEKDYSLNDYTN